MKKFKHIPDLYDSIDYAVEQNDFSVEYLDDKIKFEQFQLLALEQMRKQQAANIALTGDKWYDKSIAFSKQYITLLRLKKEDLEYGTHNFELIRLNKELKNLNFRLDIVGVIEAATIRRKIKKTKNEIQRLKAENKRIRKTTEAQGEEQKRRNAPVDEQIARIAEIAKKVKEEQESQTIKL